VVSREFEVDSIEGVPLVLEFVDKFGRTWHAGVLASDLRLSSPKHEPEIRFDAVEVIEELQLKLVSFSAVLTDG
jgi:hypothetical protein